MYGGSGKFGRGSVSHRTGALPVKRTVHSTFHRPSTAPVAHRNSTITPVTSTSALPFEAEESFSLVKGKPLNYAMIIRLAPDLVEEIKRVEAQGGAARIKFDANNTNPLENVIDVGGKDFRFTWAKEVEGLLDIYEERQSGDDGNGLLVESGSAWRKVNVQRVLDESTKNHVKMRSEEAERKQKSRRAIVLDHGNTSMKNQMKALASVEVNPRRYQQKKEPPSKKRKAETVSVGTPPKSANKSGLASLVPPKVRPSTSSLLSTPEQSGGTPSPFRISSVNKAHASAENIALTQATNKENASVSEKELYSGAITGAVQDKPSRKFELGVKPTDLRSLMISLLIDKPGMNLKALEKAIGDTVPSSVRQIVPLLNKIADFQAPGRYFLKPGVDLDRFKKPSPQNERSPEDNHQQALAPQNGFDQVPAQDLSFSLKHDIKEVKEQEQLNSRPVQKLNPSEKIDAQHRSSLIFREKKVSENIDGQAGSSSLSGSQSDSESDSSGSYSSSSSESDASSNSEEGSDEDVDIMSDDDKESKQKSEHSEHDLLTSPIPWRAPEGVIAQNMVDENHDGHDSDIVEIEKNLPGIHVVNDSFPNEGGKKLAEETKTTAGFHGNQVDRVHIENLFWEREILEKNQSKNEQFDVSERIFKHKSKKRSSGKNFDDNPEPTQRSKAESLNGTQLTGGRNSLSSVFDSPMPAHQRSTDKYAEGLGGNMRHSERSLQMYDGFPAQKGKVNEVREDVCTNEKRPPKDSRLSFTGDKHSDSHYRKHGELIGKFKETGPTSNSQLRNSPRDNNRIDKFPCTNEAQKDLSLPESNDISGLYSKYEKEAVELKGPIKDFSQYKEYVQEYREKHDCYSSLSTILDSHRSEFLKLGRDLELAKGRNKDRYNMIVRQIMESYHLFGTKHKRLKKIFVLLHEELQNLKQMIKDYTVSYNNKG